MSKDRSHRLEAGRSTTKLADGQNDDVSSGTSTKTSQIQRQVRFYRSESVLLQKHKKNPEYTPQPNRGTTGQQKNSFLEDQVCIAQKTTRTDSVPKNILNSRTCNIRDTGLCCHQRQLEFARQSGPSLYPPPPSLSLSPPLLSLSLSLSLSLHKLEILNWLGLDLLQSAVRFLKRCRSTSGSACS